MLVALVPERNLSNGELWHARDIFETGDEFSNGDISRVLIRRVSRPPEQDGEIIECRSVGEEDSVQDTISFARFEDLPNVGTATGA